jgi:hypothetical protein
MVVIATPERPGGLYDGPEANSSTYRSRDCGMGLSASQLSLSTSTIATPLLQYRQKFQFDRNFFIKPSLWRPKLEKCINLIKDEFKLENSLP